MRCHSQYLTNSHQICSESNQIEVSQNAGDDASPLSCSPECPQEEYVYDYAYADSASQGKLEAIFTKICGKNGFMIIFQVMVVITAAAAAVWKIMSLKMTLITK